MDKITFADGSIYNCPFLATNGSGNAAIALSDVSIIEAATIFSDESMTAEMQYGNINLIGYTKLEGLSVRTYGIQASLRGGHDERRNQTNS